MHEAQIAIAYINYICIYYTQHDQDMYMWCYALIIKESAEPYVAHPCPYMYILAVVTKVQVYYDHAWLIIIMIVY